MPNQEQLFASLQAFGTASVSDALDKLGIDGACLGIVPVDPDFRMIGTARTVRYASSGTRKGSVGDYIDDYGSGTVAVLDNGGRTDATVWGDILTEFAHSNRLAGTVIDGVCRDSAVCRELNYPVYARGRYMRTGKDRVQVEELDGPVTIGGIRVDPGDILLGDADGVIVLPAVELERITETAAQIDAVEEQIREAVRSGMPLLEARTRLGYHSLQRRIS